MVRLILIAAAVFLAVYPLSRRFSLGQKNNDGEGDVVGPHSRGFLSHHSCAFTVLGLAHFQL